MVRIGFSRLILLGLLLKVMLFMSYSSAQARRFQGGEVGHANDHRTMLGYNVQLHNNQKKELALASAESKTVIIGGRKMILDHKASCKEAETKEFKGKDPAPSQEPRGEANDPCNQQKTTKVLGPKDKAISGKMGIPRSDVDDHQAHYDIPSTKTEGYPSDSKAKPADDHNPTAESSSQRHREAANDEILNLMHKDYRGFPKPRRKPPINNHEPSN